MNLSEEDLKKVLLIRRLIDLTNLSRLLKNEPCDSRGNLTVKELDEALLNKTLLPNYIFEILDKYEETEKKIQHFPEIISAFYHREVLETEGFLKNYFEFERMLRLTLCAYRAKKLNRDLVKELQFEDPKGSFVAFLLAQKDQPHFEFPYDFQDLGEGLIKLRDPLEQAFFIDDYRLKKIEELSDQPLFSIDYLLSYMVKLILLENLEKLDEERGLRAIEKIKG